MSQFLRKSGCILFCQRKAKLGRNFTQGMYSWTCLLLWIWWVIANYYRSTFVSKYFLFSKTKDIHSFRIYLRKSFRAALSISMKIFNVHLHTCTAGDLTCNSCIHVSSFPFYFPSLNIMFPSPILSLFFLGYLSRVSGVLGLDSGYLSGVGQWNSECAFAHVHINSSVGYVICKSCIYSWQFSSLC